MKQQGWLFIVGLGALWCKAAQAETLPSPSVQSPKPVPEFSKPIEPAPEPATPTTPIEPDSKATQTSQVMNALSNTASRYPAFVDPSGKVKLTPATFDAKQLGSHTNLDFKTEGKRVTVQALSHQTFPKKNQLYRVLPGNRIAIETKGWQAEVNYQGRETEITTEETVEVTQKLWGLQAAWILPQGFQELVGQQDISRLNILSIAAEVTNPTGTPAPQVQVNTVGLKAQQLGTQSSLGSGSTASPNGGASLFDQLTLINSPKILQAFPTNNLQVLLEGEGLYPGAQVPTVALQNAGVVFGNPLSGEGFQFKPEVTSTPGMKIGQSSQFDNLDLLNVLVNPSIEQKSRDFHYLNALHWLSFGLQKPKILNTITDNRAQDWYQFRLSQPRNRTLLQYNKSKKEATYLSVFSNSGLAISYSFDQKIIGSHQSINSSIGLLLGSAFELIRPFKLKESLWEAWLYSSRQEPFSVLRTRMSSEERKQINQRLNQALNFTNRVSGLAQVSGIYSLPSRIQPNGSSLFQIRVGNHQRYIQALDVKQDWIPENTYISDLKISNRTFGFLSTIGTQIPTNLTGNNTASTIETLLISADGTRQFNLSSLPLETTVVPIAIRSFSNAFDRIDLSQSGQVITKINGFDGYLYLPTIEAAWTGSRGRFNYSVSSGVWANLFPKIAFNRISTIARPEHRLGLYTNALLNWSTQRTLADRDKKIKAIVTHSPSIQLSWNSATNYTNPTYLTVSHAYLRQGKTSTDAASIGAYVATYSGKVDAILFARHQMSFRNGLEISLSLERNRQIFASSELLKSLNSRWSLGAYGQNFKTTPGLNSRTTGSNFGLILQHRSRNQTMLWRARLGINGNQFEAQLTGNFTF